MPAIKSVRSHTVGGVLKSILHAQACLLSSVVLAAGLLGCGGGGGAASGNGVNGGSTADVQPLPADGVPALNAYFPTTADSRWYYTHTTTEGGNGQLSVEVTGPKTVAGHVLTAMSASDSVAQTVTTAYFSTTADGVREHSGPGSDAAGTGLDSYVMLRLPASTPAPYLQYDVNVPNPPDVDGDGRPDALRMRTVVTTTQATTPVVTAAGQFNDCVQQHIVGTATAMLTNSGSSVVVTQVGDDWYARGVGLVKSVATYTGSNGKTYSEQFVLSAYGVGDTRSEHVAPAVAVPSQALAPVRGVGLDVVVHFSEPMYPPSVLGGAVTLLDPQGRVVPGTVTMSGNDAHFQPSAVLPSGAYVLSVDTRAQDLVGNALGAPVTWPVQIDSDAPGVVGISPADGATMVRSDAHIVITLSEAVSAGSFNAGMVRLSDAQGFPVTASVLADGATLTLVPVARMQPGATYTVSVGPGIADLLGNATGASARSQFTIDPDGHGPRLLEIMPADGSVEIAPDTVIRLTFDKPLDPQSVGSITFSLDGKPFGADFTPSVAGSVVTFKPLYPLNQDMVVQVHVGAVGDLLGNTSTVPVTTTFSTLHSRFDPVVVLNLDAWVTANSTCLSRTMPMAGSVCCCRPMAAWGPSCCMAPTPDRTTPACWQWATSTLTDCRTLCWGISSWRSAQGRPLLPQHGSSDARSKPSRSSCRWSTHGLQSG